MLVHSALPDELTRAIDGVLGAAGLTHAAHGDEAPVAAAEAAATDSEALVLIGPYRSTDVAEAIEITAPAGLALLAPFATWSGLTRPDEPIGPDDPPHPRGTVLRLVARDTVVADRIAAHTKAGGRSAYVVAGEHPYGEQLDAQLRRAGIPRADDVDSADLIVLCGLVDEPEIARAAATAPLPLVAFDGVQGADLGKRDMWLALPFGQGEQAELGVPQAVRAAQLVVRAMLAGVTDRPSMLDALRALGPFDEHGDPVQPHVSLWRVGDGWELEPVRPLSAAPLYD